MGSDHDEPCNDKEPIESGSQTPSPAGAARLYGSDTQEEQPGHVKKDLGFRDPPEARNHRSGGHVEGVLDAEGHRSEAEEKEDQG